MSHTVAMTDRYADGTYRWWHLSRPSPELLAALGDGWLPPRGRALDVGCGLGVEADDLAASGWQVAGIDVSQVALARAAAGGDGAAFMRADVRRLRFSGTALTLRWTAGAFTTWPRRTGCGTPMNCAAFCGPVPGCCCGLASARLACVTTSTKRSSVHVRGLADRAHAAGRRTERHPHARGDPRPPVKLQVRRDARSA